MPNPTAAALLAILLAFGAAGCGSSDRRADTGPDGRTQAAAQAAPPALPPPLERIDGNYKGNAWLRASLSPLCPETGIGKIEVGDEKLYFAYQPDVLFVVPIQPDGTLHATSGWSVLDGTIGGGQLQLTVRTPTCASSYVMHAVI